MFYSFTVGGQKTKATLDKSQSFAADISLSQMENNMDITASDVRS